MQVCSQSNILAWVTTYLIYSVVMNLGDRSGMSIIHFATSHSDVFISCLPLWSWWCRSWGTDRLPDMVSVLGCLPLWEMLISSRVIAWNVQGYLASCQTSSLRPMPVGEEALWLCFHYKNDTSLGTCRMGLGDVMPPFGGIFDGIWRSSRRRLTIILSVTGVIMSVDWLSVCHMEEPVTSVL